MLYLATTAFCGEQTALKDISAHQPPSAATSETPLSVKTRISLAFRCGRVAEDRGYHRCGSFRRVFPGPGAYRANHLPNMAIP